MTTIADRHTATQATISRVTAQRDACLAALCRYEEKLKKLRRLAARQAKAAAKPKPVPAPQPPQKLDPDLIAGVTKAIGHAPVNADLDIPGFLRRNAADEAARIEIEQQQAATKLAKSRGRIAKMKAKASGEMSKMPLTGKAALAHIRKSGG